MKKERFNSVIGTKSKLNRVYVDLVENKQLQSPSYDRIVGWEDKSAEISVIITPQLDSPKVSVEKQFTWIKPLQSKPAIKQLLPRILNSPKASYGFPKREIHSPKRTSNQSSEPCLLKGIRQIATPPPRILLNSESRKRTRLQQVLS